jgi:hypothetical protein
LLLAFALRTHALARQELTFDEVASVFIANRGPLGLLAYVRGAIREHPPLYYLLLSLWMRLAGRSEFAIRFLSVIIGMTTVTVIYRWLRRSTYRSLALLSTLLLALSPFHVRVSRDARMYGLLALWSLLSISAFVNLTEHERECGRSPTTRSSGSLLNNARWSWMTEKGTLARWGLFWLVTGLGMFTHYFMAFVLIAEDLYLLLNWRRLRRLLCPWLAIHAGLAGLAAIWAIVSPGLWATLVSLWNRGTAPTVRWEALARALNGLYLGVTQHPNWYHLGLCLMATVLGLLPLGLRKQSSSDGPGSDRLLHGLLLGVPIAAMLALPEQVRGRYLTPALPTSIVVMAAGLNASFACLKDRLSSVVGEPLRALIAGLLPLALLCGILFVDVRAYSTVYDPSVESFHAKTEYVDDHAWPDDGLLLHGPWQQLLLSYYDVGSLTWYTIPLRDLKIDASRVDATLSRIFETHERLWVSYNSVEPVDPDWVVSRWLHQHAHQVLAQRSLALYCRPPTEAMPALLRAPPPEGDEPEAGEPDSGVLLPLTAHEGNGYEQVAHPDIPFDEQLKLEGVALSNTELTTGEAVLLLSQWRVLRDIAPGLGLRLELVGPDGRVWGHYQFGVGPAQVAAKARDAGETFVERRGLVVPIGTPPGDYALRLRVMSPEGEEWFPQGGEPCDVGAVRVRHHAPPGREIRALAGHEVYAVFGGTISLIGYAPWGHDFSQGNPLLFDIYWQALDAPDEDYELEIDVVREGDTVLTKRRVQPVADWSPTSSWKTQDVLKGHYAIPLPPDTPAGPYQIRVSLVAPDGSPLTMEGRRTRHVLGWWEHEETVSGTDLVLFGGRIKARPRRYRSPAMDHRVDVVLRTVEGERRLRLLGYDLVSSSGPGISVEPGDSLDVTLYWKTLDRMERVYAVFNHLVGPDGTTLAQRDGWPQRGTYHTTQWLPGEVVEDHYTIQVPGDAPPGQYPLRVGMYDAATKERLLITMDDTPVPGRYVELTTITVAR